MKIQITVHFAGKEFLELNMILIEKMYFLTCVKTHKLLSGQKKKLNKHFRIIGWVKFNP